MPLFAKAREYYVTALKIGNNGRLNGAEMQIYTPQEESKTLCSPHYHLPYNTPHTTIHPKGTRDKNSVMLEGGGGGGVKQLTMRPLLMQEKLGLDFMKTMIILVIGGDCGGWLRGNTHVKLGLTNSRVLDLSTSVLCVNM